MFSADAGSQFVFCDGRTERQGFCSQGQTLPLSLTLDPDVAFLCRMFNQQLIECAGSPASSDFFPER